MRIDSRRKYKVYVHLLLQVTYMNNNKLSAHIYLYFPCKVYEKMVLLLPPFGGRSLLWRSGLFVPLCFGEGGGKEMKLTWVKLRNGSSFWGDEKGNENGRNGWDIKGEQYTYVYICLSFYWCLSVFPSVDLSNSLFILRAIHISIYMSVHIHTQYIYAYVYVFLRVCAH